MYNQALDRQCGRHHWLYAEYSMRYIVWNGFWYRIHSTICGVNRKLCMLFRFILKIFYVMYIHVITTMLFLIILLKLIIFVIFILLNVISRSLLSFQFFCGLIPFYFGFPFFLWNFFLCSVQVISIFFLCSCFLRIYFIFL